MTTAPVIRKYYTRDAVLQLFSNNALADRGLIEECDEPRFVELLLTFHDGKINGARVEVTLTGGTTQGNGQ